MKPGLAHYSDFKKLLQSYSPSDAVRQITKSLKIVLMVASTSTGGSTIIRHLVENDDFYYVVSDTTRPPQVRDGSMEHEGVDYFFKSEEQVMENLRAGRYLGPALIHDQQVSGISLDELKRIQNLNKTAITNVDISGADAIMPLAAESKAIFLIPPSFEIWQNRIISRGHMNPVELNNRLKSASKEFNAALKHKYYNLVIADNVKHASQTITDIVNGGSNYQQARAVELIHKLQFELQRKFENSSST